MRTGEATSSATASNDQLAESSDGFTRLHITPLDSELLKIVVPASILPSARNISFHTIATFPEKRYGYVELPLMEAEKIKKKLNGTVLKGTKVKVEKARPLEAIQPTAEPATPEKSKKKKKKKSTDDTDGSKKRKRERDVLEGVSLDDRKVKRGWTEPAEQRRKKKSKADDGPKDQEKRKRTKSKYTDQEECLLKTKVPANATAPLPEADRMKKKKKKGKGREVTVHEFEKTTKFPSFLKNAAPEAAGKPAVEFREGTGWVDEDGNVVEAVTKPSRPAPVLKKPAAPKEIQAEKEEDGESRSSSSSSSSDSSSDDSDDADEDEEEQKVGDVEMKDQVEEPASEEPQPLPTPTSARPISSSSMRSLTIKIPPPITPSAVKVHPLEALYKRPKADGNATETPAQESKPFSFFGADNDDDEGPSQMSIPMTPFTRQEFEWRSTRSAAPTPDTAHPTRVHNFWASQGDSLEEEDEEEEAAAAADEVAASVEIDNDDEEEDDGDGVVPPQVQVGTSDFQKWFWENRRELNRSWMQRRKTVAKEKRHRDNKTRASKAV